MKIPPEATPKPWGGYLTIFQHPLCRIVRCWINERGKSSVHLHERQDNIFVVESGYLTLETFDQIVVHANASIDQRGKTSFKDCSQTVRLKPNGQFFTVPKRIKHRFQALADSVILEIYLGENPVEEDIVRFP